MGLKEISRSNIKVIPKSEPVETEFKPREELQEETNDVQPLEYSEQERDELAINTASRLLEMIINNYKLKYGTV